MDFVGSCHQAGYLKNGCTLYLQPGLQCSRIFDGKPGSIGGGRLYGGSGVVQRAVAEVVQLGLAAGFLLLPLAGEIVGCIAINGNDTVAGG